MNQLLQKKRSYQSANAVIKAIQNVQDSQDDAGDEALFNELMAHLKDQWEKAQNVKRLKKENSIPGKGPMEFRRLYLKQQNPSRFNTLEAYEISFCLWNETDDANNAIFEGFDCVENDENGDLMLKKHVSLIVAFPASNEHDEKFRSEVVNYQGYCHHYEDLAAVAAQKFKLPMATNWFFAEDLDYGEGEFHYDESELEEENVSDIDLLITRGHVYSPHLNKYYPTFVSEEKNDEMNSTIVNESLICSKPISTITIEEID